MVLKRLVTVGGALAFGLSFFVAAALWIAWIYYTFQAVKHRRQGVGLFPAMMLTNILLRRSMYTDSGQVACAAVAKCILGFFVAVFVTAVVGYLGGAAH